MQTEDYNVQHINTLRPCNSASPDKRLVLDLELIIRRFADELAEFAAADSRAARRQEAMLRCADAGNSWQDAMDQRGGDE